VRNGNTEFRDELNAVLKRERGAIKAILDEYGIPQAEPLPTQNETTDN
jgi:hypothetical protein